MIGYFCHIPKYTLVALFCAAIHNIILVLTDWLGFNIFWCQMTSALTLLPIGFLLQTKFIFGVERSWRGFLRYSVQVTNFPLALFVLWLTRDRLAVPMWIAAPISTVVLYLWNYATSHWALHRLPSARVKGALHG